MKHIDRLTIKAKKIANKHAERLIQAFIHYDPKKKVYVADGRLWGGIKGSGCTFAVCECASEDEAFMTLHELGEKYPNDTPIPIIYGDYALKD